MLDDLDARGLRHRVLFLDAAPDILLQRFKETRRRHPLADGGQVSTAIQQERTLLEPLRERADVAIDTSDLSASRLRKIVVEKMLPQATRGKLAVTILTFGFKHGAPGEADLLFDVRFLPNPHYDPRLRPLTGRDEPVRDAVLGQDDTREFLAHLRGLLAFLIPRYAAEGKTYFTLGIGCTGGRHRSVTIVEEVARCLREEGVGGPGVDLFVRHRDLGGGR